MINIADHPVVQAQLARDVAVQGESAAVTSAVDVQSAESAAFNVADLPAVQARLDRDIAARDEPPVVVEYARAPAGPVEQRLSGRPPAAQGRTR